MQNHDEAAGSMRQLQPENTPLCFGNATITNCGGLPSCSAYPAPLCGNRQQQLKIIHDPNDISEFRGPAACFGLGAGREENQFCPQGHSPVQIALQARH